MAMAMSEACDKLRPSRIAPGRGFKCGLDIKMLTAMDLPAIQSYNEVNVAQKVFYSFYFILGLFQLRHGFLADREHFDLQYPDT